MNQPEGEHAMHEIKGEHLTGAKAGKALPLPPPDGPLLSFADVGAYLRLTQAAVRTLVNGRATGSDGELGDLLRSWLVTLSPHRRYIRRDPFLAWLREKSGSASGSSRAR